jgi:hypothetical protein
MPFTGPELQQISRLWGGTLNVLALLLFMGSTALAVQAGRRREPSVVLDTSPVDGRRGVR